MVSEKTYLFGFLGGGNMATAIIKGLLKEKLVDARKITVYDIDDTKLEYFKGEGVHNAESAAEVADSSDYVVLALKPGVIHGVLSEISKTNADYTFPVYISIAAAVPTQHICEALKKQVAVIRIMPNTPVLVGEGAVAMCKNKLVTKKQFQYVCMAFSKLSIVSIIEESQMNAVISVNGSSPAYVYLFIKAMIEGAKSQGISEEQSLPLILQTIRGSVTMVEKAGKSVDELIKMVSSPHGTTLAALEQLYNGEFETVVSKAMEACTKRADEISGELVSD